LSWITACLKAGLLHRTSWFSDLNKQPDYNIFPNPATSRISMKGTLEIASVEVLDLLGRTVKKVSQINAKHFVLNTELLAANTYLLKTVFIDGTVSMKKIVVL
jgi:hypothetical protein